MSDKHLHIISFDVPFPADYGGVIDVFYKIKALSAAGVKVHLHCFQYGRERSPDLEELCEEVCYYPRNMNRTLLMHPLPFIVVSRQQDSLLRKLLRDDYPIFFEGKHTTYYLDHPDLEGRKKYVRTHNVEADYYAGLARSAKNPLKRWYFMKESKKLKNHRPRLAEADLLFCISANDLTVFQEYNSSVSLLPPFHANESAHYCENKDRYCLYHGNLGVGENEEAAIFLIDQVFKGIDSELKIFGSGASSRLVKKIDAQPNVKLIEGGQEELEELVKNAQINVLPTFQPTGMKLKLLYSLFNGGHVLVNGPMVVGTGAESLVHIASGADEFKKAIEKWMPTGFTHTEFDKRKVLLEREFSNRKQAEQIMDMIFP